MSGTKQARADDPSFVPSSGAAGSPSSSNRAHDRYAGVAPPAAAQAPAPVSGNSENVQRKPEEGPDPFDYKAMLSGAENDNATDLGEDADGMECVGNPRWPLGPTVGRKSMSVPLAEFIRCLREYEKVYTDPAAAVQGLRRLYYSAVSGPGGSTFDWMIDTEVENLPTSPPLGQDVLNTLYATEVVAMPDGSSFDISHIMCQLDLAINGRGGVGGLSSVGANTNGVLTWTGDLGSWFKAWLLKNPYPRKTKSFGRVDRDADAAFEQPRLDFLASKKDSCASLVDLLGDMDAQNMATQAPALAEGATSLADIFDSYYSSNAAEGVDQRFPRFVMNAIPAIPHTVVEQNPLTVRLTDDARASICNEIQNAVSVLMTDLAWPADGFPEILWAITDEFIAFLQKGLETGVADW